MRRAAKISPPPPRFPAAALSSLPAETVSEGPEEVASGVLEPIAEYAISGELRNAPDSTLLHEIRHAIQNAEGFTPGAGEDYWTRRAKDGYDGQGRDAKDLYRNTAGEIEARDAASRRAMDEEARYLTAPDLGDENTVFAEGRGENLNIVRRTE